MIYSQMLRNGINAGNDGAGELSITSTGTITSVDQRAIGAENTGDGGLTITTQGDISAHSEGIEATNYGDGIVNITASGAVSSAAAAAPKLLSVPWVSPLIISWLSTRLRRTKS